MTIDQEAELMSRYLNRLNLRYCLRCSECDEQIGLLDFEFDEPRGWFPHRADCKYYTQSNGLQSANNVIISE